MNGQFVTCAGTALGLADCGRLLWYVCVLNIGSQL